MPFRCLPNLTYFMCTIEKSKNVVTQWSKICITRQSNSKPIAHSIIYICVFIVDLYIIPILHFVFVIRLGLYGKANGTTFSYSYFFLIGLKRQLQYVLQTTEGRECFFTFTIAHPNFVHHMRQGEQLYTLMAIYSHQQRNVGICLQNWFTKAY